MNRKEMVRAYKERAREMGIYQVRNTANGKVLIGSSADLPAILNRHRSQLKLGGHSNRVLVAEWKAFGAEAFTFEVLDTLPTPEQPDYDPSDDLATL